MSLGRLTILKEVLATSEFLSPQDYQQRTIQAPRMKGKALAIIGVRRSGKSTFLRQVWDNIHNASGKDGAIPGQLLHVNFFDDRILPFSGEDFQLLLEAHSQLFPERRKDDPLYIFLDEVQLTNQWELFVNRMLRKHNTTVYISGSSARMLSKEIASAMRGRSTAVEIFPFSFQEFCKREGVDLIFNSPEERGSVAAAFNRYLHDGGFPEVLDAPVYLKRKILQEYIDTMLLRDVIERNQATDALEVADTLKILLGQIAAPYTLNKLVGRLKSLGHKTTLAQMSKYLAWFEDCYLLYSVPVLTPSKHKQMTNPRKLYCVDNGLWRAVSSNFVGLEGQLLENLVFIHLRRHIKAINYYRTRQGGEVDFVLVAPQQPPLLVQVSYSISDTQTKRREITALNAAMEELDVKNGVLVIAELTRPREEKVGAGIVHLIPAHEFLAAAIISPTTTSPPITPP